MLSLQALTSDKQSFFSLLSPDLVHVMRLQLLAARMSGLGLCEYFLPNDALDFTPDIIALAPSSNAVEASAAMAVLRCDPPVGALLRTHRDPHSWLVFTRRGVISPIGFRAWGELRKLFVQAVGNTLSIGSSYVFMSPIDHSWDKFAAAYKAFMSRVSPCPQIFELGNVDAWANDPQGLAQSLAAKDDSPFWVRRLVTRLGRDMRKFDSPSPIAIYPAVAEDALVATLLACGRPTDEGVILLKRYDRRTAEGLIAVLHLLITEREFVWASRQFAHESWEVHSIAFKELADPGIKFTREMIAGVPRNLRFQVPGMAQPLTLTTQYTDDPTARDAIVLVFALCCLMRIKMS